MKTIAIANQKGGTGKTTTAYNLGIALTQQGYRVLMVDFDPQGNLSCYCGIPPEQDLEQTITELLMKVAYEKPLSHRECVYQSRRTDDSASQVDFIPSNLRLASFELAMGTMMCREVLLKTCLEQYSSQYDYCIIDCSPSVGLLLTNALSAANEVIIPMQAQPFSVVGMSQLTNSISSVQRKINPGLHIRGVLLTMTQHTKVSEHYAHTESTVIVLDGLNNYTETVTVAPSEYYCAAAVQYDALGDYPLQEINQTTFLQAEGGNHYDLIYTLAGSSWYESVTGQQRHYTLQPLETPPENYEPKPAQVGAYLTAPVGFSQHAIVYLQNLYTDDVYDLELYESNGLAAVEANALSGKYAFLSAYVVGDAENRYQFSCEQNELSTETGADFHLTVTDTASPDREMNTPSRDQNSTVQAANSFNNRNTDAPQQSTTQPEIVSQPVKQQKKQLDLLSLLLDFMSVVLVVAVLFAVCRKHRR